MDARELPARPSLTQYKKQAKDLLEASKAGDFAAIQRFRKHHPRFNKQPDSTTWNAMVALADAQWVVAREHGFESWPKFARHIAAAARESSPDAIWKSAEKAVIDGDVPALERLLREHEPMFRGQAAPSYRSGGLAPDYSGGDARAIVTRNHDFENWPQYEGFRGALARTNSAIAQFEAAVDAVVAGDVEELGRLLRANPALIRARSARTHHATLLHYVGANGVEYFRQVTPNNAVAVAKLLLDAGAAVDALADLYGGSTTLGLAATSIHPVIAGVEEALMEILIAHGAAIDGGFSEANAGGYTTGAVNGCLANGRPRAAEFLADHGARLDLEGAAGVGRLDVVKGFFSEDGALKGNATKAQMTSGFQWACAYGRTAVVDFLLDKGIEVGESHRGATALHQAALNGQLDTVRLLLARKASVAAKDETWGNTPLGWALHGWSHRSAAEGSPIRYHEVVALLVAAGARVEPGWLESASVRADPEMLAALAPIK